MLVLVGIPGSGKSSVGSRLAEALGVELVETDALVEDQLQASATEAFAQESSAAVFRAAEELLALQALQRPGILALGSGAVESEAVREALAGLAVFWLRTSVATTTRRLGMTRLGMEVLAAIRNKLDAQLVERAGWYESVATAVIDTDRLGVDDVATRILTELEG